VRIFHRVNNMRRRVERYISEFSEIQYENITFTSIQFCYITMYFKFENLLKIRCFREF
jgi:hypothetical protein